MVRRPSSGGLREVSGGSPDHFRPDNIAGSHGRNSLEDTPYLMILNFFQNWLYKIASVREVVPRFYLETALLKCYKFSCDRSGFSAILERLTIMIRVNIISLVIIILYSMNRGVVQDNMQPHRIMYYKTLN